MKSELCADRRLLSSCVKDYSLFNEERQSFSPRWTNQSDDNKEYSSTILKSFQYQSSTVLDTYVHVGEYGTYSGNGYVYEFQGSLSQLKTNLSLLHQLGWIDENTRAIIIQFTLYNPNSGLFTSAMFLVENLSSGGMIPSSRFEPINFYGNFYD